jgi:hypothetical protein
MSTIDEIKTELRNIIGETQTPPHARATLIVDDLMNRFGDDFDSNPMLQPIGDLANKIKDSGASEREDGVMWAEIIRLVHNVLDS